MINCQYCGFSHEVFQPTCSACGAPLRVASEQAQETEPVTEKIRRYCLMNIHVYQKSVFLDPASIPEQKARMIKKSFRLFPNGKEIYLYCDTGPLNNGKQGFLICEDGIYWQNGWLKSTNRNFLPWDKFREREIILRKYDLDLGAGDIISLAGMGREVLISIVESIFKRIQIMLREST